DGAAGPAARRPLRPPGGGGAGGAVGGGRGGPGDGRALPPAGPLAAPVTMKLSFASALFVLLSSCGGPDDSLSGTVAQLVVSRAEGEQRTFVLTTASEEIELFFAQPPDLSTGDQVRVTGRRLTAGEARGP